MAGPDTASLYSSRDVARIFELNESRVLYWARTGLIGPSVRRGGRQLFTFADLITVKAAKELIESGVSLQAVRKNLAALRAELPDLTQPLTRLRVLSDGSRLVVVGGAHPFEPLSGQLVMDFAVGALSTRVEQVLGEPPRVGGEAEVREPGDEPGQTADIDESRRSAYGWFLAGCKDDEEQPERAERAFRRAVELDPAFAAAHTNLGNLAFRRGLPDEARVAFERALALDPGQPEARFNLGNLHDHAGESDAAIAAWTMVVAGCPEFADAHFNLGVALGRTGAADAARAHLRRYLALEVEGPWADEARSLLRKA